MKKALIIAYNDLNNSGVPNVIYQTIMALHDSYIFDVLIFEDNEYYYKKLQGEGIEINIIKYHEKKPNGKLARLFWWFFKSPNNHHSFMKQLLNENDYSIIHSFKEFYSWPFFKAAREFGIEKRILHRNINPQAPNQLINRILEHRNRRLSLKYSTSLVGVSELCCQNAFKNKNYSVLYNSYNDEKYNMSVKNTLNDDELVITQVGSFGDNKNQLFSLNILKELKTLHSNAKLNLVGATEITPYYQELINYVKENCLEENVSFIERCDNVESFYEKTTFTLLPSFSEGLPLSVIESQACGIRVFVSSNVTREIDVGGVKFLDLSKGATYWANEIYKEFNNVRNKRFNYNVVKFSFDRFKRELEELYN